MAEDLHVIDPPAGTRVTAELWAGVLLAPLAWVVHLMGSYAVATTACGASPLILHGFTLTALAAAGAGGLLAWRAGRHLRDEPGVDRDRLDRRRFMRTAGAALSAGFAFVIAVQALPPFLLRACE